MINQKDESDLSFFETLGFSMWPFLRQGEKVVIKKVLLGDLRVGDIIAYKADNQTVCHRLVKLRRLSQKYLFYTRGDNSTSSPEKIEEEAFLGKVIGVLRKDVIINFTGPEQFFINRFIVIIAPWVSRGVRLCKKFF